MYVSQSVSIWKEGTLWSALSLMGRPLAAFVGAGGKTATISRLLRESAPTKYGVIVTVTTKLGAAQQNIADRTVYVVDRGEREDFVPHDGETLLVAGTPLEREGKIDGVSPDLVCELAEKLPRTPILIEADGAAGALLKVPGPAEPVIPRCCNLVAAVTAASALGDNLSPSGVHRYADFARLIGGSVPINPERMASLLRHPQGSFKDVPDKAHRVWMINQADTIEDREKAMAYADAVVGYEPDIDTIIVGSARSDIPVWYRQSFHR